MPETKHNLTCAIYFQPSIFVGEVRKQEIVQQVENMIRCAFRENNNYGVTRTYPFSRFSWSKLGEEIHDNISENCIYRMGGKSDIQSDLSIPRIQQLSVTVQK